MRYVIVKPKLIGYKILMTSPAKKKKKPNYSVPSNASSNNRYLVRNMLWLH